MKMRVVLAVLALVVIAGSPASAEPINGTYSSIGEYPLSVEVWGLASEPSYAARFTIGRRNDPNRCGQFTAAGERQKDGRFVFSGINVDGQVCRVTMNFSSDFNAAAIEEKQCGIYHEPTCKFQGAVQRISH